MGGLLIDRKLNIFMLFLSAIIIICGVYKYCHHFDNSFQNIEPFINSIVAILSILFLFVFIKRHSNTIEQLTVTAETRINKSYKYFGFYNTMISLLNSPLILLIFPFGWLVLDLFYYTAYIDYLTLVSITIFTIILTAHTGFTIILWKTDKFIKECEASGENYKDSPIICRYIKDKNGNLSSFIIYKEDDKNVSSALLINEIKYYKKQNNQDKVNELIKLACESKINEFDLYFMLLDRINFYKKQKDFDKVKKILNLTSETNIKTEELDIALHNNIYWELLFYFPSNTSEDEDKMKEYCKITEEILCSYDDLYALIADKYFTNFKQYKKALKYINEAIRLNDTNSDYFILKAKILFKLKEPDEAIEEFLKAEKLTKLSHEDLAQIAITYNNKGDYKNAIIYADKALKIKKNSGDALYAKGLALYGINKYADAYEFLKRVKKIGCSYTGLDKVLEKLNCLENAEQIMKKDIL